MFRFKRVLAWLIWLGWFFSCSVLAEATWPIPDDVRPLVAASTWQDNSNNLQIDVSDTSTIGGAVNGLELGYFPGKTDFSNNHAFACSSGPCVANPQLALPVNKSDIVFDRPSGATRLPLSENGNVTVNQSGVYYLNNDTTFKGTLTIEQPVTLYATKFKLDGGKIIVTSGDPDDFILVLKDDTEFINGGTIDGHAFSDSYLMLKRTSLTGAIVSQDLKVDEFGETGANYPAPVSFPDTCDLFTGPAQRWDGNFTSDEVKVRLRHDAQISGAYGGNQLGFDIGDNFDDKSDGKCDGVGCIPNPLLMVSEPNFRTLDVAGASNVRARDQATLGPGRYGTVTIDRGLTLELTGGEYEIDYLRITDGELAVTNPTLLNVNQIDVITKGTISHDGSSEEFWIVVHDDSDIARFSSNGAGVYSFNGLIVAKGEVRLRRQLTLRGGVTAPYIDLRDSARIVKNIPDECAVLPSSYELRLTPTRAINLTCDLPQTFELQVVDSNGDNATDYSGSVNVELSGSNTYQLDLTKGSLDPVNGYLPDEAGLLQFGLSDTTAGIVNLTASLPTSPTDSEVNGSYQFAPYVFRFDPQTLEAVSNQATSSSIQAMQCDANGEPEVVPESVYSGVKDLAISATSFDEPSSNLPVKEPVQLRENTADSWRDADGLNSLSLDFSLAGQASLEVLYPEAGEVSYTLSDEVCVTEDGASSCETIIGMQQVEAIPWAFAICHTTKSLEGTSESGTDADDTLVAAGELFELQLRPLRYQNGISVDSLGIAVSALCDSPQTENFFAADAAVGKGAISASLATPSGGTLGDGLSGTLTVSNQGNSELLLNDLSWDEVGSLNVQASGTFLGRSIATSYRNVGRFYPDHLAIESDYFYNPIGHSGFTYMGQPTEHGFVVEAREAQNDAPTLNYGRFASDFMVTIDYDAVDGDNASLIGRVGSDSNDPFTWQGSSWGDDAQLSVAFSDFKFERLVAVNSVNPTRLKTSPDGPMTQSNTQIGLKVSSAFDGVNWKEAIAENELLAFSSNYAFRYGRMVLSDVSGNSDSRIRVPLSTEYWNGTTFVDNPDDGISAALPIAGTLFDGQHYCSQSLWQDQSATAPKLDGSGGVVDGLSYAGDLSGGSVSSTLNAVQQSSSANTREQVRLWLRLDSSAPLKSANSDPAINCSSGDNERTWLRYDWRGLEDEDPSTVVTFGTFRGNDRVIYRGEAGLTGN